MLKTITKDIIYSTILILGCVFILSKEYQSSLIYSITIFGYFLASIANKRKIVQKILLFSLFVIIHYIVVRFFELLIFTNIQPVSDDFDKVLFFLSSFSFLFCGVIISYMGAKKNAEKHLAKGVIVLVAVFNLLVLINSLPENIITQHQFRFLLFSNLLIIPNYYITRLFFLITDKSANEKTLFKAIVNYPEIVCTTHNKRIKKDSFFGYKNIQCLSTDPCEDKSKIIAAKKIIGIIGKEATQIKTKENNFYIQAYNEQTKELINGDFDFIDIYENKNIKNYDAVINKITHFLYNELDRSKPIKETIIRIFGFIQISKSTERLLKEKFAKVEYVLINR